MIFSKYGSAVSTQAERALLETKETGGEKEEQARHCHGDAKFKAGE